MCLLLRYTTNDSFPINRKSKTFDFKKIQTQDILFYKIMQNKIHSCITIIFDPIRNETF